MIHLGRKSVVKLKQAEYWPTTQAKIIKPEVLKVPGNGAQTKIPMAC